VRARLRAWIPEYAPAGQREEIVESRG